MVKAIDFVRKKWTTSFNIRYKNDFRSSRCKILQK